MIEPHVIKCKSIKEARFKSVDLVAKKGKISRDQRGEQIKYVKHLITCISGNNCELSNDPLTARCGEAFAADLIDDLTAENGGRAFEYTYGWELREENAIEKTYELLRSNPETRRAVIPLFKSRHVGKEDVPCMTTICFDCEGDYLNLTIFARSNEEVIAMQNDLYGFSQFLRWMAERLGYEVGDILLHVVNAHIRINSEADTIKRVLEDQHDS